MTTSKILIIDNNKLIALAIRKTLHQQYHINMRDIRILPDSKYQAKNKVEDFLKQHAHKYMVLINANCSFSGGKDVLSYDGVLMLALIYKNVALRPLIISLQSLRHLKNANEFCKILLEDEELYYFCQLPGAINFKALLTQEG